MSYTVYETERTINLITIVCANCGITFAVPKHWDSNRRYHGDGFWCPNGHSLSYDHERGRLEARVRAAEEKAARAESRRLAALDQAQAAERSAAAYKGQVTKIKRRVSNGVCPECKRSFANVRRHMETQHPECVKKAKVIGADTD